MYFAWHFYIEKQCTLRFVAIYKESDTMSYILICKKQNTFLYVHIYNLWCSPRSERSYQKISSSSFLRIGPIPTINKEFLLHTREWEWTAPLGLEHVVSNVVPIQGKIMRWTTTSASSAVLTHSFLVVFLILTYAYINWTDNYY